MSRVAQVKHRLRERAEHHLLLDAARRMGAGAPGTAEPFAGREGLFWRLVVRAAVSSRAVGVQAACDARAADDRQRLDAAGPPAG